MIRTLKLLLVLRPNKEHAYKRRWASLYTGNFRKLGDFALLLLESCPACSLLSRKEIYYTCPLYI